MVWVTGSRICEGPWGPHKEAKTSFSRLESLGCVEDGGERTTGKFYQLVTGLLRVVMDCSGHSSENRLKEEEMRAGRPNSVGNCCLGSVSWCREERTPRERRDLGQDWWRTPKVGQVYWISQSWGLYQNATLFSPTFPLDFIGGRDASLFPDKD